MDFRFTDEQRALQEALGRFVQRGYGFEQRRAAEHREQPLDTTVWGRLAELGVTALNVPEDDGGLGGGATETLLAQLALAPGLLLEPVLASSVIATRLLAALARGEQRRLLAAMAAGERIVVVAHGEAACGDDPALPATVVSRQADASVCLRGAKAVVLHAPCAHEIIVSAREGDGDSAPTTLWLVPRDSTGMRLLGYRNIDGQPAADLAFDGVALPAAAQLGERRADARPALRLALDAGLAALCAEAVGIMDATVAATAEYLRTRQQFGQPIGRFQALQHRMADMLMHVEQSRSMAYLAAMRCTETDAGQRARALSAAKVVIGQACRYVAQQAVQLHGGMGMSDELIVSHYFKRLTAIELSMGHTDVHLQRFAALSYGPH